MGIADRDYARSNADSGGSRFARSGSGFGGGFGGSFGGGGRVGGYSVNTWLIIINVSVALIGMFFANVGLPVHTEDRFLPDASWDRVAVVTEYASEAGERARYIDQAGRPITDMSRVPIGANVYRVLLDADNPNDPPIGRRHYRVMDALTAIGHFSTEKGFIQLQVWRLVTFQFLHGGFLHLALNMFGLWIFGSMVEQALGGKRYLAFYLVCGIAGGLLYLILNLAGYLGLGLPGALSVSTTTPLVGASAGVFGVILAGARLAPNTMIQLLIPPVPLKLKWFAAGYIAIALFNLLTGGRNAGGDAAHIGGAIAGFFFIKNSHLLADFFDVFGNSNEPKQKRTKPPKGDAEIERILSKVSSEGLHSLTDGEKRRLREETERRRG